MTRAQALNLADWAFTNGLSAMVIVLPSVGDPTVATYQVSITPQPDGTPLNAAKVRALADAVDQRGLDLRIGNVSISDKVT